MKEEKWILIIIVVVVVLVGGLWFLNRSMKNAPADTAVLVRSDSASQGPADAKVTVVEFGDYQCPACGASYPIIKQTLAGYPTDARLVFRNFPLSQHPFAPIAAEAAEVAGDQGKYWEMHDMLYEHQDDWVNAKNQRDMFIAYAGTIGLNVDQFTKDLDAEKYKSKIDRDVADGIGLGINATPTFYVNGTKVMLEGTDTLKNAIDAALK